MTLDAIEEAIAGGRCEATGIEFQLNPWPDGGPNPFAPSLDQIIPGRGYTPENTRVVCWFFNRAAGLWDDSVWHVVAMSYARRVKGET